ncbi:MAG: tetratricopeptide repeat protein [Anaerolineae bacterium]
MIRELQKVEDLKAEGRWAEAVDKLQNLGRRNRDKPVILDEWLQTALTAQDVPAIIEAGEMLLDLEPDSPELTYDVANAYLHDAKMVLSYRKFKYFLGRWPKHELVDEARSRFEGLRESVLEMLPPFDIPLEEKLDLAAQNERIQLYLKQGRFREGRRLAQEVREQYPTFAPAYNNLGLLHWLRGELTEAIEVSSQVLEFEPDNVHALANLVHFLYMDDQVEEARAYAERLKTSKAEAWEAPVKKAEALMFVEAFEDVVDVFEEYRADKDSLLTPSSEAFLYHMMAVAVYRLGDEERARRYWEQALVVRPGYDLALGNLADLEKTPSERIGAWAFPATSWIDQPTLNAVRQFMERASRSRSDAHVKRAVQRLMQRHPRLNIFIPILLKRGDPFGCQMAYALATIMETPEVFRALADFARTKHGTDEMRIQAGNLAAQNGALPSGPRRMWIQGEWREIMLLSFEIYGESDPVHSPKVEHLAREAAMALNRGDVETARSLLEEALEEEPDAPGLLNNFAKVLEMEGSFQEALELTREIHEQHPDYLFARISLAQTHIDVGEIEEAHNLLDPILERERLHYSEFGAFCAAYIRLNIAEGNLQGAQSWLQMWEEIDPENPNLLWFKQELNLGLVGPLTFEAD